MGIEYSYYMKKVKIAISLDKTLLDSVDSKIDNNLIRSRSQAIELYLRRGLKEEKVDTSILLVAKKNQRLLLKKFKGISLIKKQIQFFQNNNIKNLIILTPRCDIKNQILDEIHDSDVELRIIEQNARNNGEALLMAKEHLPDNHFIVMNGNVYSNFDIKNMFARHLSGQQLAIIGLMSRKETTRYGTAILDGDLVVDFLEKPKVAKSNIVNAGIYIFRKEVKELFSRQPIEIDLLPKLAKIKQLLGYFTMDDYLYFTEKKILY